MTPKTSTAVAIALCLGLSAPVFANDAHHPEKEQAATTPSAAPPASVAPQKTEAQSIKAMQDNVVKMQKQLSRIAKAKSDEEREKLMTEHMQTLHESMMMAKGMQEGMGCPMMDGMMSGKGEMGMGKPGTEGQSVSPGDRMQRMEMRMDMMEKMMKPGMGGDMAPGAAKP